jgi:integrase
MGATYTKRGKSYRIAVHANGERAYVTVKSEADAKALVREVKRLELNGQNVLGAIKSARSTPPTTTTPTTFPALRVALDAWIDGQVRVGDLRESTAKAYRSRLRVWAYPKVGDLPVDQLTREQLGACIRAIRGKGMSSSIVRGIRNPLRKFYEHLVETKVLAVNPAADLRYFVGRIKTAPSTASAFFTQQEGPRLLEAARALHPRWATFIMTGLLGGLRWGEIAALYVTGVDFEKGRIHVQRTVSARTIKAPNNSKTRWVTMSPALAKALRAQIESTSLEVSVKNWTTAQRQLVFPTVAGNVIGYTYFIKVWKHTLAKARLPYRKSHALRHTFATWLLSDGADLRFVQAQLGHASITMTADTYGHLQADRHEHVVSRLDKYVG